MARHGVPYEVPHFSSLWLVSFRGLCVSPLYMPYMLSSVKRRRRPRRAKTCDLRHVRARGAPSPTVSDAA